MSTMQRAVATRIPCAKCPFRKDVPIYLRASRREAIARELADGGSFLCHGTVDYSEDDDGNEFAVTAEALFCAGAAKALALSGGSSQELRIAERLGLVDMDALEGHDVEVWPLHQWPTLTEGSTADASEFLGGEPCSTCDAGCLAPAGYLGASGGVVVGTEAADGECATCGEALCSNCADNDGNCHMCSEETPDEHP